MRQMKLLDLIQEEIKFTTILVKSVLARNALDDHECEFYWCSHALGCAEAERLSKIDGIAFEAAIEAIAKRGIGLVLSEQQSVTNG